VSLRSRRVVTSASKREVEAGRSLTIDPGLF